jgi:glycosyltransferase involved in cell wall biosynthesis
MFLVIPSECYENNPRTVIEAFALGKPAVGARIGGIPELVRDWETGLTYTSGDVDDLHEKITLMLKDKDRISEMGRNARAFVEKELNAVVHYRNLMKIYERAMIKSDSMAQPAKDGNV